MIYYNRRFPVPFWNRANANGMVNKEMGWAAVQRLPRVCPGKNFGMSRCSVAGFRPAMTSKTTRDNVDANNSGLPE